MYGSENAEEKLIRLLDSARPEDVGRILAEYAELFDDPRGGFPAFMRRTLKKKGVRQQDMFLRADVSEGYGYKLISGEKRTRRRDTLLRLFIAARFDRTEADRALKLVGMPALYPRFKRDAVIIIALNCGISEPAAVDDLLLSHGLEPLSSICAED